MTNKKPTYMKNPCSDCPMRKDCTKEWLGEERITSILNSELFICHKTSDGGRKQCCGHMLLAETRNIL